jgi:hypothetical protein
MPTALEQAPCQQEDLNQFKDLRAANLNVCWRFYVIPRFLWHITELLCRDLGAADHGFDLAPDFG